MGPGSPTSSVSLGSGEFRYDDDIPSVSSAGGGGGGRQSRPMAEGYDASPGHHGGETGEMTKKRKRPSPSPPTEDEMEGLLAGHQHQQGISKDTSITYSHAVHGVLKELIKARLGDQGLREIRGLDRKSLINLIIDQQAEADRIAKRDKRGSYFRYLKEFLGIAEIEDTSAPMEVLPNTNSRPSIQPMNGHHIMEGGGPVLMDTSKNLPILQLPPSGSQPPGQTSAPSPEDRAVWSDRLESDYLTWLQAMPPQGLGMTLEEATSYTRLTHNLLKKLVVKTNTGAGNKCWWGLQTRNALATLLSFGSPSLPQVFQSNKNKKVLLTLQAFLDILLPSTKQAQGSPKSTTGSVGGGPGTAIETVWNSEVKKAYRRWLQEEKQMSEGSARTYSQYVHGILKALIERRVAAVQEAKPGARVKRSGLNAQELVSLITEQYDENPLKAAAGYDQSHSYFRYLREFLGLQARQQVQNVSHVSFKDSGEDERAESGSTIVIKREKRPRAVGGGGDAAEEEEELIEDVGDEERTENCWPPPPPPRQGGNGSYSLPGGITTMRPPADRISDASQSPLPCKRCRELQSELDEKEMECQRWRKRAESLAVETRELQRVVADLKRGGSRYGRSFSPYGQPPHQDMGIMGEPRYGGMTADPLDETDGMPSRPPKKAWATMRCDDDHNDTLAATRLALLATLGDSKPPSNYPMLPHNHKNHKNNKPIR